MKILDLFCGGGGFSCGFIDKGNHFIGVDSWSVALETYRLNIKGETIQCDVMAFDVSTVGKIDILIGSPPCQPHSTANKHATHDPSLIKRYLEIKDALKPRWWIMEEVPGAIHTGLIAPHHQRFLRACDFGLPHMRKRLFAGEYPVPKESPCKPELLLPGNDTGLGKNAQIPSGTSKAMFPTPTVGMLGSISHFEMWKRILTMSAKNQLAADQIKAINDFRDDNGISDDSTTGIRAMISVEFCAWLMGFPGWYTFCGTKTEQFKQIGNAVCPPISKAIWEAIKSGKHQAVFGNLESFLR